MQEIPNTETVMDEPTRLILRAMKEQIEVLTGQVGDGSLKAMTQNDLKSVGVINLDDEGRLINPAAPGPQEFSDEPLQPGSGGIVPVGGVLGWLKSLTAGLELPAEWLECNGQVVADESSKLNGVTLPNLNGGGKRFLRGDSASGTVGGAATHVLTVPQLPAHTHGLSLPADTTIGSDATVIRLGFANNAGPFTGTTGSTGAGAAHNNEPQFYTVVWVIRIK